MVQIIRKVHKSFKTKGYHIYIAPIERDSWEFIICKQRLLTKLNYLTKRITGIRFLLTQDKEKVYIDIESIVTIKTERNRGEASFIFKTLIDTIGRKNISKIELVDVSEGFWEKISKKYKRINWVIR